MKTMYVYILQCSDGALYVGVTNNLEKRLIQHNEGINEDSFTYSRRPVHLQFYEIFDSPDSAIQFEKKIKKWSRQKKQALIDSNWERLKNLSTCINSSNSKNDPQGDIVWRLT